MIVIDIGVDGCNRSVNLSIQPSLFCFNPLNFVIFCSPKYALAIRIAIHATIVPCADADDVNGGLRETGVDNIIYSILDDNL